MSSILTAFGVNWQILLIDIINFGIVLFALWYFLYGPLMRMLTKRQELVAQGVHDAEEAGRVRTEIEGSRATVLSNAGKEADDMLSQARRVATDKEHQLVAQGEAAATRLVMEAEAQSRELKAQALLESKEEVAKLIVLGIEKTIGDKSNA